MTAIRVAVQSFGPLTVLAHIGDNRRMSNGSLSLGEYPSPVMRLACSRCERRGRYHVHRLIEEHGPAIALPDLRGPLATGCPRVGHQWEPCGIYYADLALRRDPA